MYLRREVRAGRAWVDEVPSPGRILREGPHTPMPPRMRRSASCAPRHDPDERRDDGREEEQHHDDSENERDVRYEVVALERNHAEEYERGFRSRQHGARTMPARAGVPSQLTRMTSRRGSALLWFLTGVGIEYGVDLPALVETSTWLAGRLGRPSASAVVRALST